MKKPAFDEAEMITESAVMRQCPGNYGKMSGA
jgi:hypothetical protein